MRKYKTILADPPWLERGAGKCKRGADRHYNLMHTKDIISLFKSKIIPLTDDDCHFYLWVTNNFLEDGLRLMNECGFRYITNIVWVKDKKGLGQYFRGEHELLLFGVKGNFYSGSNKEGTVIRANRSRHSQKPRKTYSKIENVSQPPRIEVFARERLEGWDVWGDEAPNETQNVLQTVLKQKEPR